MLQCLLLLLALEAYVCWRHLQYALILLIVFGFLVPPLLSVPLGPIKLNTFNLSCFIFCVGATLHRKKTYKDETLVKLICVISVTLSIMSFVASLSWRPVIVYVKDTILYMLEFFAVGLVLPLIPFSRKDVRVLSTAFLLIGIFISLYAVMNYIMGYNPYIILVNALAGTVDMASFYMDESRGILARRSSSTFLLPLALGQFMCMLQLYLVYIYRGKRWLSVCLYFVFFVPIVLSGSRSCIFPALLFPLVYFFFCGKMVKLTIAVMIVVGTPAVIFFLPDKYSDTILATVCVWDEKKSDKIGIHGSGVSMRKDQMKSAMRIIEDSPFIGKGIGYVKEKGADHKDEMLGYEGFLLQSIIESGMIGTSLFLLFFFIMQVYAIKRVRCMRDLPYIISFPIMYLMSIIMTGVVYSSFCYYLVFYTLFLKDLRKTIIWRGKEYSFHPLIQ